MLSRLHLVNSAISFGLQPSRQFFSMQPTVYERKGSWVASGLVMAVFSLRL
jgi:hypothetical protein